MPRHDPAKRPRRGQRISHKAFRDTLDWLRSIGLTVQLPLRLTQTSAGATLSLDQDTVDEFWAKITAKVDPGAPAIVTYSWVRLKEKPLGAWEETTTTGTNNAYEVNNSRTAAVGDIVGMHYSSISDDYRFQLEKCP